MFSRSRLVILLSRLLMHFSVFAFNVLCVYLYSKCCFGVMNKYVIFKLRALILYRRRRFINHLLTYLLTYNL